MRYAILTAALLVHSAPAAAAWLAEGSYYFGMNIEEAGFQGEARLEYSGRLTPDLIDAGATNEGAWFSLGTEHGLLGWDRINGGAWVPMAAPIVYLDAEDLMPVGAWNWDGAGQFDFIRADGVGAYARFPGGFCDWDAYGGTCRGGEYAFRYRWESAGTVREVHEPSLPALLAAGLLGLLTLRRRPA